jgi:SAM-dependent methyltransferase
MSAREEIFSSESKNEELRDWWETAHSQNKTLWLSGYPGPEIWNRLEVEERLVPGATVLEIGVGLGYCTRALFDRGCEVHTLDISAAALDRVKEFATTWIASELDRLPEDKFDVAISHLVAQHMFDHDLETQIRAVVRALRRNGVFAMQFSKPVGDEQIAHIPGRADAKGGSVWRTPERLEAIVNAAGGKVVRSVPKESSQERQWAWHVAHIMRQIA